MNHTRALSPAFQAETAADYNGLPHARITETRGQAHVFTVSLHELEAWYLALGGHITSQPAPAGSGVVLWTLHTSTGHGHGTPVIVHALAMDTDRPDADITNAAA